MGHHRPEPAIKNFRLQGRSENELASAEYFSAEVSSLHALHAVARIGRKKAFSKGFSAFVSFISFFKYL